MTTIRLLIHREDVVGKIDNKQRAIERRYKGITSESVDELIQDLYHISLLLEETREKAYDK